MSFLHSFQIHITALAKKKRKKSTSSSSTSSRLSTMEMHQIMIQLKNEKHKDSTRKNYYAIWKVFNEFFIKLDLKPRSWEHRLHLFVAYLVDQKRQSSTVKSYISAIKAVLMSNGIDINEDQYLLSAMTKACKLKNDRVRARLPIQKGMLNVILRHTKKHFDSINQPFLGALYMTLFSTAYYGMFRVGELTSGTHPVLASPCKGCVFG